MIRSIFLLLLSTTYAFSLGFWTLSGVTKANIYVLNEVPFLEPETISTAKDKMISTLKNNGIKVGLPDSPTLMIELQEMENDGDHYVYVKLILGEEVKTFRDDESITYALTFQVTDFIETDTQELDSEVLESVNFLLSQFSEQFEDDKE